MIEKKYGVDFGQPNKFSALTLEKTEVANENDPNYEFYSKTHPSGWSILGKVIEDHFTWVNDFVAIHEDYGFVCGNFENIIYAEFEKGFDHFYKHHTPEEWDYEDI